MTADALGHGAIEFDTTPQLGQFLLDFDPTGEIDVQTSTGALVLSLTADAACTGNP